MDSCRAGFRCSAKANHTEKYLAIENEKQDSMRFKVLISEGEDGWFVVECPSIPGCVSQGKTIEEALENIKDAIQGCLDVLSERVQAKGYEKIVEVVA